MTEEEILNYLSGEVAKGLSKSQVERNFFIATNTLSSILSGKKKLTEKAIKRIEKGINKSNNPTPEYKEGGLYLFSKGVFTPYSKFHDVVIDPFFVGVVESPNSGVPTLDLQAVGNDETSGHFFAKSCPEDYDGITESLNGSKLRYVETTPESYDGGKKDKIRFDEAGQWKEPSPEPTTAPTVTSNEKVDRKDIEAQIEAVKAEKIPEDRNKSLMGRRSWALDQEKRILELEKQLNG